MTPNLDEALALTGLKDREEGGSSPRSTDFLNQVGNALMKGIGSQQMVVTRGKDGMSLFQGAKVKHVPTFARSVFDVTGAGDTAIAALSLAWSAGLSLEDSCLIANYASGVVVAQIGCVPCTTSELLSSISSHFQSI